MGDTCKDFRSWEEEIFWTHFQSIQFSQFLRGDFVQRLQSSCKFEGRKSDLVSACLSSFPVTRGILDFGAGDMGFQEIPEKFAKNIKKKLPETVTLKGPSGIIWDVGLTADNDTMFFDHGWKVFVEDHCLVENDFLIFKFNGVSNFDVLMFDGPSLCEKASSYFVRKGGYTEFDSGHQKKRKMNENSDGIVQNSSQCGPESSLEKSTNNDIDTRPSRQPYNSPATNKKMRNVGSSTRSIHARRSLGGEEQSTFAGEVKVETEFEHTTMDGDVFSPRHASCKRPVTHVEKKNVILMAQEAVTKDGFMVVMKASHVGRQFCMAVPTAWAAKHLSKENADVVLCINERSWWTRFNYNRSSECGRLCGRWRKFVNDNNLEEGDVCVFKPASIGKKTNLPGC